MMMKGKIILLLFLLINILFSCNNLRHPSDITSGTITYDITYLQNNLENIETNLLPKTMTLKFNKKYSLTKIDGFMGLLSIALISDFQKSKDITMVKFFDNKYVHYCDKNEISSLFKHMNVHHIEPKSDTSMIYEGYEVKTAKVLEEGVEPYTIYYTDKIGVSNPNRNNPFSDVDGVLLKFQLQLLQLRMNLTARKIDPEQIPDEEFEVPDEYKSISQESMVLILNKMLESN